MRRSSLDNVDIAIERELSSQFDAVKLVAGVLKFASVVIIRKVAIFQPKHSQN